MRVYSLVQGQMALGVPKSRFQILPKGPAILLGLYYAAHEYAFGFFVSLIITSIALTFRAALVVEAHSKRIW